MIKLLYNYTDKERLEILEAFNSFLNLEILEEDREDVLGQDKYDKIEYYYNIFDKLEKLDDFNKQKEIQENKEYEFLYEKSRLFITHYYLVMYMAMQRGDLPIEAAKYYGLTFPFEVPSIICEEDLLSVSATLFDGDANRVAAGGRCVTNPNIGTVRVWVEKFNEVYFNRINKYNVKKGSVENIDGHRQESDNLIFWIFNFLTKKFENSDQADLVDLFKNFKINISVDFPVAEENEETHIELSFLNNDSCSNDHIDMSIERVAESSLEENISYNEEIIVLNCMEADNINNESELDIEENCLQIRKHKRKKKVVAKEQLEFDLFF